jgi:hypothetical protein
MAVTALSMTWLDAFGGESLPQPVPNLSLPRKIVFTPEDAQEINSKGTLRERAVSEKTYELTEPEIWEGLPVFSGRKEDVIAWIEQGEPGLDGIGGSYENIEDMLSLTEGDDHK